MGPEEGLVSAPPYTTANLTPGYAGYVPPYARLPLRPKASVGHVGRVADAAVKVRATLGGDPGTTTYTEFYEPNPPEVYCQSLKREGGGYWFKTARQPTEPKPFLARTTYQAEILDGENTAAEQLARSEGLKPTLVYYEGARRAQANGTLNSQLLTTSKGDKLGYQTESAAMTVAEPLTITARHNIHTSSPHQDEEVPQRKFKKLPRAMYPRFAGASGYTADFGAFGSDPLARSVARAAEMSGASTTQDLNAGTSRVTHHPPGYTGFIPASTLNPTAVDQAAAPQPRRDGKVDSLLFALDQYSRSRLPHYTGTKPQAVRNISVEQPAHGPTAETTQGYANLMATSQPPAAHGEHFLDSRKGIMGFFNTGGSLFVSDNGETEAQRYFMGRRARRR